MLLPGAHPGAAVHTEDGKRRKRHGRQRLESEDALWPAEAEPVERRAPACGCHLYPHLRTGRRAVAAGMISVHAR